MCESCSGGGNAQSGCGSWFDWGEALPYQQRIGEGPTAQENMVKPPREAQTVIHEIGEGIPRPCDICHEPIKGPLIKCLNCSSVNTCLRCHAINSKHHTTEQMHVGIVYFHNDPTN